MPKFTIELSNQVCRILDRMARKDSQLYKRIARALDDLECDPSMGKPLKGQLKGRYSYRIGSHRIIYLVKKSLLIIFVIDIGHRRDIYK